MSLPSAAAIETLDYAFGGEPFVSVAAKSAVDTSGLDYAFGGEPFVAQNVGGGGGGGGGSSANTAQLYIICT